MAFSVFGQICASGLRRQSLCARMPMLVAKNSCQYSIMLSASQSPPVTNAWPAAVRPAPSSSMRECGGRVPSCPAGMQLHTSARLGDKVKITFKTEKESVTLSGAVGDSLLDIVNNNSYEIDGFGACDGTVACSTCHCVLDQPSFNVLNKGITEEEQDLLDMASGRQDTSRLGCQVYVTEEVDGVTVEVPNPVDLRDL